MLFGVFFALTVVTVCLVEGSRFHKRTFCEHSDGKCFDDEGNAKCPGSNYCFVLDDKGCRCYCDKFCTQTVDCCSDAHTNKRDDGID